MSSTRIALGKFGEDLACEELARRGYAILARRYRSRDGELDIVAREAGTLVFVEVKLREGNAFGEAEEAVTAIKRRRIVRLAQEYLMRHHIGDVPCRFDVVAIRLGDGAPSIEVFSHAFDAD
ncbi:MAG: YraN family protein [Betaproteobacteria bacterium]